jgi:GntR family transcriptional repressor for pyruvate dehydrogenase complex
VTKKPILKLIETSVDPYASRGASTYAGQIIAKIREALFQGKLKEGDFLGSEKDLAAQFGVSRVTARDAYRTLEAMGIIEIRVGAGGGARIAAGNPDKFGDALAIQLCLIGATEAEIMDVQIILEERAAELAAKNRTKKDIKEIAALLAETKESSGDPVKFMALNHMFHLKIAEAAKNRVMDAQLKALHFVLWPNQSQNVTQDMADKVLAVHEEIFEAIKAGDGAGAKSAMSAHLSRIAHSNPMANPMAKKSLSRSSQEELVKFCC